MAMYRVIKQARGMDGEWFDFPVAFRGDMAAAIGYAEEFAHDQRGVHGVRITVRGPGQRVGSIVRVSPVQAPADPEALGALEGTILAGR